MAFGAATPHVRFAIYFELPSQFLVQLSHFLSHFTTKCSGPLGSDTQTLYVASLHFPVAYLTHFLLTNEVAINQLCLIYRGL